MQKTAQKLCEVLRSKELIVSTAESCTGGMIGASITSVPGSSECYGFGFVTYANEAKMKLIGVNDSTLTRHGAVSSETAKEMAEGALNVSGADIAVSVTGIAGPGGGSEEKPVGLVYIGIAVKGSDTVSYRNIFDGTRDEVREQTVIRALNLVIDAAMKIK